ncbi:UNKNOWN [Stylonychia lemnae]|uniref:Uncharacterized protein n=1 Tax=Stylonychia lemnae TaxID=5949 RepID=A0A078AGM7_STYLE|nr:UNKNOWN [Stylonychia lemnae]|eukprot:CDW80687.1 UNKNOWN [Stylonychia lemnae]
MEFGHKPAFENTFRLEPRENERFYPSKVRSLIEEVILRNLKDKEYDHATAKTMAESIADQIKMQVKALNIPSYKIVVQTVIGEITGQGVRVASKCLWDDQNDNLASFTYQNNSLFCTGMVFGVYYE